MFVVEDLLKSKFFTVHAQLLMPRLVQHPEQPVHRKLLEHAEYLESWLQLANALSDVCIKDENFKISVSWLGGFRPDDCT